MQEIRLETEDERFVCVAQIPPFITLPDVVLWGQRIFQCVSVQNDTDKRPIYREGFAVAIVIPVSYEDDGR